MIKDAWIAARPPSTDASIMLFCLPHAGGGASAFRDWQDGLGPDIDLLPIFLPGRERRIAEPLPSSMALLADQVADVVTAVAGERPFAIFGHSMGGLLGYELAQRMTARGRKPERVLVSGSLAPKAPRESAVHRLPDDELIAHITQLEGTPDEILTNPALLELTLPILRADFAICERYRHPEHPPLLAPLTVLGGRADRSTTVDDLRRWHDVAGGEFTLRLFDGGHFYLHHDLAAVLDFVGSTLRAAVRERSAK